MSEQQTSGRGKEGSEAAAVKELLEVRGTLLDLATNEDRLDLQRLQLQSQISGFERQTNETSHARQTSQAHERVAALQSELNDIQEQLARLQSRKNDLTTQQQRLLDRLDTLRAEQQRAASKLEASPGWSRQTQSEPQTRSYPGGSRRLIISLGILTLVLVLSLTLARALYIPADTDTNPNNNNALTFLFPTFQPNGKGPTNAECQVRFSPTYSCYSPEDIQQSFSLTPLYESGYLGQGQTIVILGAGYTTRLQDDLYHFDQTWGLPDPPSLRILQPHGPPTPYTCGTTNIDRLQIENTVDVEWAHAIAPGANIVLIIGSNSTSIPASSGSPSATGTGSTTSPPNQNCLDRSVKDDLAYALNNHLGQIISISQTFSELGQGSDTADQKAAEQQLYSDSHALFEQAISEHVTVIAAAGNSGATNPSDLSNPGFLWTQPNVSWPASDPDVLAVGGTIFSANAADTYSKETVWNTPPGTVGGASGGGLSALYAEPDYQQTVPNQLILQGRRGVPDVAFPAKGLLIYGTFQDGALSKVGLSSWAHWDVQGGTGAGAACWAGLIALANQAASKPLGFIQPALYNLHGVDMHDITSGNNDFAGVQGYEALSGYDLATGWGTPNAQALIFALIQASDHTAAGCRNGQLQCL